jgi:hypothetical protein
MVGVGSGQRKCRVLVDVEAVDFDDASRPAFVFTSQPRTEHKV